MKRLGLILARGGSKGIPRKNLVELGGKPLIQWTIDVALKSSLTSIVCSTDDDEIAEVCEASGVEVLRRPAELASDEATSHDAEMHALADMGPDVFVRLQPTSPFRSPVDINNALDMLTTGMDRAGAVVGVAEVDRHPSLHVDMIRGEAMRLHTPENRSPRQYLCAQYAVCGSIYAAHVDYFRKHEGWWGPTTYGLIIPRERALDIDDWWDLQLARGVA